LPSSTELSGLLVKLPAAGLYQRAFMSTCPVDGSV
jgi:hypothetical protein